MYPPPDLFFHAVSDAAGRPIPVFLQALSASEKHEKLKFLTKMRKMEIQINRHAMLCRELTVIYLPSAANLKNFNRFHTPADVLQKRLNGFIRVFPGC